MMLIKGKDIWWLKYYYKRNFHNTQVKAMEADCGGASLTCDILTCEF